MASAVMPKTAEVASFLGDRPGAGLAHLEQAPGAVVEHPGHDHADGAVAGGLGRRAEQDVDAGPEPADGGAVDQLDAVAAADPPDHAVVVAAGHDQRPAAADGLAVTGLGDLQGDRRVVVEPLGEGRGEPARHVLDDHDPGASAREAGEQPLIAWTPPVLTPMAMIRSRSAPGVPGAAASAAAGSASAVCRGCEASRRIRVHRPDRQPCRARGGDCQVEALAGAVATRRPARDGSSQSGLAITSIAPISSAVDGPLGMVGAEHDGQGVLPHQLAEEGQPVHPGHLDVEHDRRRHASAS